MKTRRKPDLDPCAPTDATPGSPKKLLVLMLRARRNLPLWLPGDAGEMRPEDLLRLHANRTMTPDEEE